MTVTVYQPPTPRQRFVDSNGNALVGGQLYSYQAGTSTPQATYTDASGTTANTNPIVLDARGECSLWLDAAQQYKFVLKDSAGSLIWTADGCPGASLTTFAQAGAGAVIRTVQNKLRDVVDVRDFGAVGDGVTDDSAAFAAALSAASTVEASFGTFVVKNVSVGTNKTIRGKGSIFRPAVGATSLFTLTGFRPTLQDAYFDGANGNLVSSLGVNGAVVVLDATYPTVDNCQFVNLDTGMVLRVSSVTSASQTTKGSFSRLKFDTITVRGIYVGPNVNTCTFSDIRMYVGVEMPANRPRRGCTGFQIVSTGSLNAAGGHFLKNIDVEQAEYGFQFTDATLTEVADCYADSLAASGYQCTGACSYMKFADCFAGTCLIGFDIDGTAQKIWIDSAATALNGTVPPWWVGPGAFYDAGSPFDIAVKNTAQVMVGSWFGDHKVYCDTAAVLAFEGGDRLYAATSATVAAGATRYFGPAGMNAAEFAWVAPRDGVLVGLRAQADTAPGAGQSFTYTARLQFADTGLTAAISGASQFDAAGAGPVAFTAGQNLAIKLVTSGTAAAANHRLALQVKYF